MTTTTEAGSASSAIQPIMLNNSFKVDVNVIRLGDLFTNIGIQEFKNSFYAATESVLDWILV